MNRFTHGFAAIVWAPAAPEINAINSPSPVNVSTIAAPYVSAIRTGLSENLVKYETVIGIMGKTQGVSNAANAAPMASHKKLPTPPDREVFNAVLA